MAGHSVQPSSIHRPPGILETRGLHEPSEPSGSTWPIHELGQLRRESRLGLSGSISTFVP